MASSIFAQMQMQSMVSEDNTIVKTRNVLNNIVNWFKTREDYMYFCDIFAQDVRNLDTKTITDADGFFVNPDMLITELPTEFQHDVYGLCYNGYIRFSGRFVYPVKDIKGNVMGFCGYDKFSDVKYLDSINFGYVAKQYSFWGMEQLGAAYRSKDNVFFVEGIVCASYLRQCGFFAFATLGANFTSYALEVMKRFGSRGIYIADSDEAGTKTKKRINREAPLIRVIQSSIAKDVDDSRMVDSGFVDELRKLTCRFYVGKGFR